jgi:hypothetical protein
VDGHTPFRERAERYCALVERIAPDGLSWRELAAALAELYAAALALEPRAPDGEELADAEPADMRPALEAALGGAATYWTVFDPAANEEPGAPSLADDLADVYHDVKRGLMVLDAGDPAEAVWEWHHSFWSHWGRHAVEALRALHALERVR